MSSSVHPGRAAAGLSGGGGAGVLARATGFCRWAEGRKSLRPGAHARGAVRKKAVFYGQVASGCRFVRKSGWFHGQMLPKGNIVRKNGGFYGRMPQMGNVIRKTGGVPGRDRGKSPLLLRFASLPRGLSFSSSPSPTAAGHSSCA